jgi:hypothetical protein
LRCLRIQYYQFLTKSVFDYRQTGKLISQNRVSRFLNHEGKLLAQVFSQILHPKTKFGDCHPRTVLPGFAEELLLQLAGCDPVITALFSSAQPNGEKSVKELFFRVSFKTIQPKPFVALFQAIGFSQNDCILDTRNVMNTNGTP